MIQIDTNPAVPPERSTPKALANGNNPHCQSNDRERGRLSRTRGKCRPARRSLSLHRSPPGLGYFLVSDSRPHPVRRRATGIGS